MTDFTIQPPKEYKVPLELYKQNRVKVSKAMQHLGGIILLKGVPTIPIHDQDIQFEVQQESNFMYLIGLEEVDCYAVLEVATGRAILFVPEYPQDYKMWMKVFTMQEIQDLVGVDEVMYIDKLEAYLNETKPATIHIYNGIDSDSGLVPDCPAQTFLSKHKCDDKSLYSILNECRVTKSAAEIEVLRFVCMLSSEAHERVLRNIKVGNKEYQIEALFQFHNHVTSGAKFNAYDCICASGRNAGTLHYNVNDKYLNDGSLVLADMGAKYRGYCSDITVTFPISGKFNPKQRIIYNAVLDAMLTVHNCLKPGVNWGDMHLLAERTIIKHLHEAGIVVGNVDEINKNRIGALFFAHGLGHLLGLRVHDVGGYNVGCPERSSEEGLKRLRFRRNLEVGMVLTNEPGCYFIEYILE
jgi:Xaa-Pro dipeptidase